MDERYEKELARLFDELDKHEPGTPAYKAVERTIDNLRRSYVASFEGRKQRSDEELKKRELDIKEAQARQQADIEWRKLELEDRKQYQDDVLKKRELNIKEAQARQQADIEQQKLELDREQVVIDATNAKKEHKRKWWEILLPFLGALGLYGFSIYVDQHSDSLLPKWAADITRKHGFRK